MSQLRHRCMASLLVFTALSSAACTSGPPSQSEVTVGDSAGVAILENHESLSDLPEWKLTGEPILAIGPVSGAEEYRFHLVNGAIRLPDGRLAVTNSGSQEIRFYDASGKHLGAVGGEGEGPGEYRFPVGLWKTSGDSLAVWDSRLKRMTLLDSQGEFGRAAVPDPSALNIFPLSVRPNGTWVMFTVEVFAGPTDYEVNYATVLTYRPTGQLADSVATIPWWELKRIEPSPAGRLFGWRAAIASAPDGIWYGDSHEYELRLIDDQGNLRRIVRWRGADRTIRPQHVQAYWEARFSEESSRGENALRRIRALQDNQEVADRFPAYSYLMVDTDGNLWARDYERPGEDTESFWTVFNPTGELLAVAHTPKDAHVMEIGGDYITAVATDALDIQHVHVYRLTK